MENLFFEKPIPNSPYEYPARHWELDAAGQPTQRIIEKRRRAEFITPIPKPRKLKGAAEQQQFVFNEGKGLSTEKQQYDPTSIINQLRKHVDQWRSLANPNQWQGAPETARLLQHWRHHQFSYIRPFFCQVEAAETAIWLIELKKREVKKMLAEKAEESKKSQAENKQAKKPRPKKIVPRKAKQGPRQGKLRKVT